LRWIQWFVPFTADNADGIETVTGAGCSCRVNVIRPGAAESEQRFLALLRCRNEIVFKLAPLVAADRGVREVFTLDVKLDTGAVQQAGFKLL
jgi:hypothetical protein